MEVLKALAPYVGTTGGCVAFLSVVAMLSYRARLTAVIRRDTDVLKRLEGLTKKDQKQIILEVLRPRMRQSRFGAASVATLRTAGVVASLFFVIWAWPVRLQTVPVESIHIRVNGTPENQIVHVTGKQLIRLEATWKYSKMPPSLFPVHVSTIRMKWKIEPAKSLPPGFLPEPPASKFDSGYEDHWGPEETEPPPPGDYDIILCATAGVLLPKESNVLKLHVD